MTAFELSVVQILALLFAAKDFVLPAENEKFTELVTEKIFSDSGYVKASGRIFLWNKEPVAELFFAVNKGFFNPELSRAEQIKQQNRMKNPQPLNVLDVYESLAVEIEVYTRWGHPQLLSYPWSLFLTVRENFKECMKENG